MYDGEGNLLWQKAVDGAGHNGIHITDDAEYIVVGGGSIETPYKTFLLDKDGNLLWEHCEPGPIPEPYHPYLISAMCVAISQDGSRILSGYGTGNPGIQFFQGGVSETTGIEEPTQSEGDNSVLRYYLGQNFPNPFNATTSFSYQLPTKSYVRIAIYNVLGYKVKESASDIKPAGQHAVVWNGRDSAGLPVASGVYLYKIYARSIKDDTEFCQIRKMVLIE